MTDSLRFERGSVSARLRDLAEFPDTVEHVGGVNKATHELVAPDIDRRDSCRTTGELASHHPEVAAAIQALLARAARREIASDVDRSHAAVVIRGVENAARLIDREVVRSGSVEVIEGNLVRRREVADVHDMDVAPGTEANRAGTLFAHESVFLLAVRVMEPPDVVRFAIDGNDVSKLHRI